MPSEPNHFLADCQDAYLPHMPLQSRPLFAGGHIPTLNGFVITSREQSLAIRTKDKTADELVMPRQSRPLPARIHVPKFDFIASRCQRFTIRTERHGINVAAVALERAAFLARTYVPQFHGPIATGRRQGLAVGSNR